MAITRVAVPLTSTGSALIGKSFATAALAGNRLAKLARGHFLRVLAARWLGLEPGAGRFFLLSTASLSALSYEHNLSQPAIRLWDDDRHVGD
jgi:probable phosphoglycerate mutase